MLYNPLEKDYETLNSLWRILIEREQCLYCKKSHKVQRCKPYCGKCYYIVQKLDVEVTDLTVSQEEKMSMREKFSFMNDVPGHTPTRHECSVCNKQPKRNLNLKSSRPMFDEDGYCFWMGTGGYPWKRICNACLSEKYLA